MREEEAIKAIQNGDETAIDWVMTKYSKLIWSIASAILKNAASIQDVEECVADVFIYLWQHPEKYSAQRGKLRSWLSVIARSQAIDKYREVSKQNSVPLDGILLADRVNVTSRFAEDETKRQLLSAIRALEEPDREILIRRYYYDQKPKAIALALDMPVKHIQNRLYRTKLKLRDIMDDLEVNA